MHFDYAAQFALAQPTLSVTTTAGAAVGEDGEPRVVLYCVRPDAIQQCTLDPALCRPSASHVVMCMIWLFDTCYSVNQVGAGPWVSWILDVPGKCPALRYMV